MFANTLHIQLQHRLRSLVPRAFSSVAQFTKVSDEVRQAVAENKPVVALESTIITHGLPYPANVQMAINVEAVVRKCNAVPATIGFVRGRPTVGLSLEEIEHLADIKRPKYKISRRDIPVIMSGGLSGGTTIAATMILAHQQGIDIMATGGLGGVSRPHNLMDVSADLDELSKTPVGVVCSGPKSILDVQRTMEYLETKGVPVFTFDDGGFPNASGHHVLNVPGFYTRDSGVPSPFSFARHSDTASVIYNGKYGMNLNNGYVFCIPAPSDIAMPKEIIEKVIESALAEANEMGVRGKDLTPFLLGRINSMTNGASVKCNVAFVKNNAAFASSVAVNLCKLKSDAELKVSSADKNFVSNTNAATKNTSSGPKNVTKDHEDTNLGISSVAVIGSVAMDSTSSIGMNTSVVMGDSNPGKTIHSIGGVGFNVALACSSSTRQKTKASPLFISAINGEDLTGSSILKRIGKLGISAEGLQNLKDQNTAEYTSVHDETGKLIVACADMDIIEHLSEKATIGKLQKHKPSHILMDSNIPVKLMNSVLKYSKDNSAKLIYEPTSAVKAYKLGQAAVHSYPDNEITMITPTINELNTMFESFHENAKFQDLDTWFPVIDSLKIDKLRDKLERCTAKLPYLQHYIENGLFQEAFRILPYAPNMFIKDGANGVFCIHLTDDISMAAKIVDPYSFSFKDGRKTEAVFTIVQEGAQGLGIVIQHFPGYDISPNEIKSVTGAGDSMVGYLLSELAANDNSPKRFLLNQLENSKREKLIMDSQKVACLSLMSDNAVDHIAIRKFIQEGEPDLD